MDELWELHEEVSQILSTRIIEEKHQLEQRLEQLNQTHQNGVSKGRERRIGPKGRRFYPKVFPKYQNPLEPSETWSGRGKQPRWLVQAIQNGNKVEDFRIEQRESDVGPISRAEN